MKTITIQTRIDTNLKKNAENILSSIGLDITSAIRLFLTQCVVQRRLPFQAVAPEEQYNEETLAAFKETEEISSWKIKPKTYDNLSAAIKDLENKKPNKKTITAMQEADDIASRKIKSKGYNSVDKMIGDILYAADEEPAAPACVLESKK